MPDSPKTDVVPFGQTGASRGEEASGDALGPFGLSKRCGLLPLPLHALPPPKGGADFGGNKASF